MDTGIRKRSRYLAKSVEAPLAFDHELRPNGGCQSLDISSCFAESRPALTIFAVD